MERLIHRERLPVVSVTSELASSLSFQSAQRPAKSDAAPANDSFAALVDNNNAAADNNNRVTDSAPAPSNKSSAPRRQDEVAANAKPRDNAGPSKPANANANNDAADRDAAVAE